MKNHGQKAHKWRNRDRVNPRLLTNFTVWDMITMPLPLMAILSEALHYCESIGGVFNLISPFNPLLTQEKEMIKAMHYWSFELRNYWSNGLWIPPDQQINSNYFHDLLYLFISSFMDVSIMSPSDIPATAQQRCGSKCTPINCHLVAENQHRSGVCQQASGTATAGSHFTKGLWAINWNLAKLLFTLILIVLIQSAHNFAHVTTAELSWHVQNCNLIWS